MKIVPVLYKWAIEGVHEKTNKVAIVRDPILSELSGRNHTLSFSTKEEAEAHLEENRDRYERLFLAEKIDYNALMTAEGQEKFLDDLVDNEPLKDSFTSYDLFNDPYENY